MFCLISWLNATQSCCIALSLCTLNIPVLSSRNTALIQQLQQWKCISENHVRSTRLFFMLWRCWQAPTYYRRLRQVKWDAFIKLLPSWVKHLLRRGSGKIIKSHDSEEIASWRHNRADALLNSHDSSGPVQVQVEQNLSMEKGRVDTKPHP